MKKNYTNFVEKYTNFVEKYNVEFYNINNYPTTYNKLLNNFMVMDNIYYTSEPTEQINFNITNLPTNMHTYLPSKLNTICPTITNLKTNFPTITNLTTNFPINYVNNNNNDNNFTTIFTISFVTIFISLFLFIICFYKYYLKYKRKKKKLKQDKLDLEFGISYIEDI